MPQRTHSNIWVIIPGFNEEKYIERVLARTRKFSPHIIVIDDGSLDRTAVLARKYTSHVLSHSINLGKGAALKTGCEYAFNVLDADAVIFLDADDQHDPAELPLFIEKINQGAQVVFGVRRMKKSMPLLKKVANSFASHLLAVFFGRYIPDIPSGYRALTKSAYQVIAWQATGYEVELEIAAKVAMRKVPFEKVPIQTIYHDHAKGLTVLDVLKMLRFFINWRFSL